jgi:hypothetical protein
LYIPPFSFIIISSSRGFNKAFSILLKGTLTYQFVKNIFLNKNLLCYD